MTSEIKAKVFAQYLGQRVAIGGKKYKLGTLITSDRKEVDLFYAVDNVSQLILKPLSAITDEDAVEVAKMMGYDEMNKIVRDSNGNFLFICKETEGKKKLYPVGPSVDLLENNTFWWDENNGSDGHTSDNGNINLACYQYLQSKGYDLPNYLLGEKTLHEAGLAIYE